MKDYVIGNIAKKTDINVTRVFDRITFHPASF
jgi:hypothetical protein